MPRKGNISKNKELKFTSKIVTYSKSFEKLKKINKLLRSRQKVISD